MVSRHEQALLRREQLIDAALGVFADRGVEGTSIKDIARAASVTPGLIYHYFDSKEALATAVLQERGFMPQLRVLLDGRDDEPAASVLPELLRAFDELLSTNAELVSVFFSVSRNSAAAEALRDFVTTGLSLLESYLQSRCRAGELDPALAGVAARSAFATMAIGHKTGRRVEPEELAQLILNGLRRTPEV